MLSLILKDFKLIRRTWLILIIFLILPLPNNNIKTILIFITHMGFVRLINYTDIKGKINILYSCLPIKRSFIIIQKYIFIFLTTFITVSIYGISLILTSTDLNQINILSLVLIFCFLLNYQYLYILFTFLGNIFTADIIIYALMIVGYIIIIFVLGNEIITIGNWLSIHKWFIVALTLLSSIIILLINIDIYKRKEL